MAFLLPFTTRQVCKAMADSMVKYDNAPDKDDFCNPDVPLVVRLKNKNMVFLVMVATLMKKV